MSEIYENYTGKIIFLSVSVVLVMTGFGIVIPILPKILKLYDGGAFELGVITAFYGIFYVIFSPIFGNLADNKGKKTVIEISLIGFGFSNLIYIIADSIFMILVARAVGGMFAAGILPASIALATDLVPADKRAKNIGYITAGNAMGFVIGPVLGGYFFDLSIYAPFYVSAIFSFIGFFWARKMLPDDHLLEETTENSNSADSSFSGDRANGNISSEFDINTKYQRLVRLINNLPNPLYIFIIFIVVDLSQLLAWLIVEPGFAFYVYDYLLLEPKDFGNFIAAFGIFVALGQTLLGSISDKIGRRPVIITGFIANAIFYFILYSAETPVELFMAALFAGIGVGLIAPAMKALLTDAAHPEYKATTLGLASGLMSLAQIVGPVIGGYYFEIFDMQFVIRIAAVICLIAVLLTISLKFDNYTDLKEESSIQKRIKQSHQNTITVSSD